MECIFIPFTPLRILNAQRLPTFALINRRQVGVLNVQRCKGNLRLFREALLLLRPMTPSLSGTWPFVGLSLFGFFN